METKEKFRRERKEKKKSEGGEKSLAKGADASDHECLERRERGKVREGGEDEVVKIC